MALDQIDVDNPQDEMSFLDHLEELREAVAKYHPLGNRSTSEGAP